MRTIDLLRGAALTLASLGIVLPQAPLLAQDGAARPQLSEKSDRQLAADVTLLEGAFSGRVVDKTGAPQKNKEVVIRQGEKEVARVTTNEKGVFAAPNLRPGNYTAQAENTVGNFRVWNENGAPPAAKGHALLVLGENGARGQFGAVDPTLLLLTAGVIASVIIAAISLDKINNVENKVDKIGTSF